MAGRRELGELLAELAPFIEQFLRLVTPQPLFELPEVLGLLEIGDRNLMGAPGPFDGQAVDEFRPGPALGRAEDDHGPARTLLASGVAMRARRALDLADPRQDRIEAGG